MTLCIRLKRKKTTYFLLVEPNESILEVKQKIQEHSNQPVEDLQILKQRSDGWRVMDDAAKVEDAEIRNEEVLALSFRKTDGSGFEPVEITPYEVELAS